MILQSDLTWIILLPAIGSIFVYALPTKWARWTALGFSLATFLLGLVVFFRILAGGQGFGDVQHLQDFVSVPWINFQAGSLHININFFLGVDGLSLPMVLL